MIDVYPPTFTTCTYDEIGRYGRVCHDCGRTFDISTPAGAGEVFFGHPPCDKRWKMISDDRLSR